MAHRENMLERLPELYRDGERVRGLLGPPAVQLEVLDEDGRAVQRAHFFDLTPEREEAERLAAVLDIPAEPWQSLRSYRAWVHALRNARLRYGSVTIEAAVRFVAEYARGFQDAEDVQITPVLPLDPGGWLLFPPPVTGAPGEPPFDPASARGVRAVRRPVFLENPPAFRCERAPADRPTEPLHQFSVLQRGLDETEAGFLLVGVPGETEYVPTVVNLTTGQALVYLGSIPTGARLWIRPTGDGRAGASLDGVDVSERLYSVSGVTPGAAWDRAAAEQPARAVRLARGENRLWFLPVAHYDQPGLDRVLLALADVLLRQGRYDETRFDQSLFYQYAGVQLTVGWIETQPACYAVRLPAGTLRRRVPEGEDDPGEARAGAEAARDQLLQALTRGVDQLRGAGIRAEVLFDAFGDAQPQQDRLALVLPLVFREGGPTGADRMTEAGGLFDVTGYNDSTFR